jgi:hypothetical protein
MASVEPRTAKHRRGVVATPVDAIGPRLAEAGGRPSSSAVLSQQRHIPGVGRPGAAGVVQERPLHDGDTLAPQSM